MDTDRQGGSQAGFSVVDFVSPTGWIERGHIPTLKIGRYRLINLVALMREAFRTSGGRF